MIRWTSKFLISLSLVLISSQQCIWLGAVERWFTWWYTNAIAQRIMLLLLISVHTILGLPHYPCNLKVFVDIVISISILRCLAATHPRFYRQSLRHRFWPKRVYDCFIIRLLLWAICFLNILYWAIYPYCLTYMFHINNLLAHRFII